jgi:hypothetical protein
MMERGADISACGRYRYRLWRFWGGEAAVNLMVWVMLNPSTADDRIDDPTIRRCMSFARREGFNGIMVVNLFALRATDPDELMTTAWPLNDDMALEILEREVFNGAQNSKVVFAWGAHKAVWLPESGLALRRLHKNVASNLWCLGRTKGGYPKHPLYLPNNTPMVMWSV